MNLFKLLLFVLTLMVGVRSIASTTRPIDGYYVKIYEIVKASADKLETWPINESYEVVMIQNGVIQIVEFFGKTTFSRYKKIVGSASYDGKNLTVNIKSATCPGNLVSNSATGEVVKTNKSILVTNDDGSVDEYTEITSDDVNRIHLLSYGGRAKNEEECKEDLFSSRVYSVEETLAKVDKLR